MFDLVLSKNRSFYESFVDTKWIIKTSSWGLTLNSPYLSDERRQLVKLGFHKYEVKNKSPRFIPIGELVDKFAHCRTANFKSKNNKSSIVKVYIDDCQCMTRTSGKLKLKNGSFKTNLQWLSKALTEAGLTDVTPDDWVSK